VKLSDTHPFGSVKKHLFHEQFAIDADMKQAVASWLQALDANFFCEVTQEAPLWYKCLNVYMVITRRSDLYHLLSLYHVYVHVRIKSLASATLTSFFKNIFISFKRVVFYITVREVAVVVVMVVVIVVVAVVGVVVVVVVVVVREGVERREGSKIL
jgi:hypothetical protein